MKLHDRAQRIIAGLATESDFEGMDAKEIIAIKGDQSEMHTRFVPSGEVAVERKAGEPASKPRFRHVASDESVDAMGDVILVAGWALERFQKNPQLLWAHDARGLPVGLVEKIHKGRNRGAKALLTESVLHSEELNPMAPMVERLIESGALPGVSVGFIPKVMVFPDSEEQRKALGLGENGVLHKEQELLELSVVPVPANSNALQRSMLDRSKDVFDAAVEGGADTALVEHLRATLCMTEEECRRIRRRTIVVPDIEAACAKVVKGMEAETALPPADMTSATIGTFTIGGTDCLPDPNTKLIAAVNRLTTVVETLAQTSTERAAPAEEVDPAPLDPAADPGRDFVLRIAREAAERLSG